MRITPPAAATHGRARSAAMASSRSARAANAAIAFPGFNDKTLTHRQAAMLSG